MALIINPRCFQEDGGDVGSFTLYDGMFVMLRKRSGMYK
jgi:hypothetical protein